MSRLMCHLCLVLRRLAFLSQNSVRLREVHFMISDIFCLLIVLVALKFLGLEVLFRIFSSSNYREVDKIFNPKSYYFQSFPPIKHIVCVRFLIRIYEYFEYLEFEVLLHSYT